MMYRKLFLTFFLFFSFFIAIYPSKKENTNLFDYCYSFEKIISRNSVSKSRNLPNKSNLYKKDITFYFTNYNKIVI